MAALTGKARTAETYLAGLGATGALIAGAVVAFLLLVGMVTFDAWPRGAGLFGGDEPEVEAVGVIPPADAAAGTLGGASDLVASARPGDSLVGAPPSSGGQTDGTVVGDGPGGGSIPGGRDVGGGQSPVGGGGGSSGGGGTVQDTVSGLGDTVNNTVGGLEQTVHNTVDGLGQTVNNTVDGLGQTVNKTLNGLGQIVNGLTGGSQ